MTTELLVAIAGIVLTVMFSYIPGLRVWYAAKSEEFKKLFMLVLLILVAGAMFGLGCAGLISIGILCTWMGAWQLLGLVVVAVVSNQAVYAISPQTADVKAIKIQQKALALVAATPKAVKNRVA